MKTTRQVAAAVAAASKRIQNNLKTPAPKPSPFNKAMRKG